MNYRGFGGFDPEILNFLKIHSGKDTNFGQGRDYKIIHSNFVI